MNILPWVITAFTVIAIYLLERWENKRLQSIFDWIPAILLAYIIPAIVTHLADLDFSSSAIHNYSKTYFIPLAIIAVMSSLSIHQLKSIGWKPIVIFIAGSIWIALFPVLLIYLMDGNDLISNVLDKKNYWKGIPPIVGSWIGGSTSQLVLKEIVECPENIFLTILVLDNILVNIWTILMFQGIKKSNVLNGVLRITDRVMPGEIPKINRKNLHPVLCLIIFISIIIAIEILMSSFIFKVITLSILGLILGNRLKSWNHEFSLKLGSILILIIMAVLGLKLTFETFDIELSFLYFLIIWLVGHFIFMLLIAKILNANIAWVPIASMANVGGIATAPAVTAAYRKEWMPHAIILAILSMATGTIWGMVTIYLLNLIFTS